MFPETVSEVFDALEVCAGCPVREPCAAYAVATGQLWGVWGGLSERDLRAAVRAPHPPGTPAPLPAPSRRRDPYARDPRTPAAAARARASAGLAALRAATGPSPVPSTPSTPRSSP